MASTKCKKCGKIITIAEDKPFFTCEYCGTSQRVTDILPDDAGTCNVSEPADDFDGLLAKDEPDNLLVKDEPDNLLVKDEPVIPVAQPAKIDSEGQKYIVNTYSHKISAVSSTKQEAGKKNTPVSSATPEAGKKKTPVSSPDKSESFDDLKTAAGASPDDNQSGRNTSLNKTKKSDDALSSKAKLSLPKILVSVAIGAALGLLFFAKLL